MIVFSQEAGNWPQAVEAWAERAESAVLAHFAVDPALYDTNLLATDDAAIKTLNGDFRGKATATNVLSWPAYDLAPEKAGETPAPLPAPVAGVDWRDDLGDIALAYETVFKEAQESGISLEAHTTHLIVHAILHLLGYDHVADADAEKMETIERVIMAELGFSDPYADNGAPLG